MNPNNRALFAKTKPIKIDSKIEPKVEAKAEQLEEEDNIENVTEQEIEDGSEEEYDYDEPDDEIKMQPYKTVVHYYKPVEKKKILSLVKQSEKNKQQVAKK